MTFWSCDLEKGTDIRTYLQRKCFFKLGVHGHLCNIWTYLLTAPTIAEFTQVAEIQYTPTAPAVISDANGFYNYFLTLLDSAIEFFNNAAVLQCSNNAVTIALNASLNDVWTVQRVSLVVLLVSVR